MKNILAFICTLCIAIPAMAETKEYTCQWPTNGSFEIFIDYDAETVTMNNFVYPADITNNEITWTRCRGCTNPDINSKTVLNRMTGELITTNDQGTAEDRYGNVHTIHHENRGSCGPAKQVIN